MMERDDHIFDEIIRKKLDAYSDPVPEDVWENISSKRKLFSGISYRYRIIGGLSVLLLAALTVTISMTLNPRKVVNNSPTASIELPGRNSSDNTETLAVNNVVPENKQNEEPPSDVAQQPQSADISPATTTNDLKTGTGMQTATNETDNQVSTQNNPLPNNEALPGKNESKNEATPVTVNTTIEPEKVQSYPVAVITPVIPQQNTEVDTEKPEQVQSAPLLSADSFQNKTNDDPVQNQIMNSNARKTDTASVSTPAGNTNPADPQNFHFRCLDLILSGGLVSKTIEASDPASASYANMLNGITKGTWNFGVEVRYRYYINEFWNIATGLKYYMVKEELTGQVKPGQTSIRHSTGTIISPFGPPKQVMFTDTITTNALTVSQYNTYTYLRLPLLIGANFVVFKTPLNLYAGFGYYFSIKQNGTYINPSTLLPSDFENTIDNPYKNANGVNVQVGLNANRKLSQRTNLLFGIDYSRYVIPITDNAIEYQQYYQTLSLNLGITYQLF